MSFFKRRDQYRSRHVYEVEKLAFPWRFLANIVRAYIRFCEMTTSLQIAGDGPMNRLQADGQPMILLLWHGRNFQTIPVGRVFYRPVWALTSRSRDGAMIAHIIRPYGFGAVQGSGTGAAAKKRTNPKKRGAQAFRSMLKKLQAGESVMATADVPPGPVYQCGPGMVQLAAFSGAAIMPVGCVYSPELPLAGSWDKARLPLPFGRRAFVFGAPIYVPPKPDAQAVEAAQEQVNQALNALQAEAALLLGKKPR